MGTPLCLQLLKVPRASLVVYCHPLGISIVNTTLMHTNNSVSLPQCTLHNFAISAILQLDQQTEVGTLADDV